MQLKKLSRIKATSKVAQKFSAAVNAPARSSFYFTAAIILSKGASFLLTPIFTRLLTAEEYGEYSLFSSYLSVLVVIVTLEIPGSVIIRAFQKNRGLENLTTVTAAAIPLALTPPAVLILKLIGGGPGFSSAHVFLALSLASVSFINLYTSSKKFLYKPLAPTLTAIIQSVVTPIISILLINLNTTNKYGDVTVKVGTCSVISALTALTLLGISASRAVKEAKSAGISFSSYISFAKTLYRTLLSLCLPLLPYYFSVMMISQADKLIISSYLGREALGRYSLAYTAGIAPSAMTGGIMGALCPWIMRKIRAENTLVVRRALSAITSSALPAIVIFLCAAPEIFAILAPESYQSALPVLFISAMIPIPLSLCTCLCSICVAKEKTAGPLIAGILSAAAAAALDFFLIRKASLSAPALITAGGYITLMLLEALSVRKILGKSAVNANKTFQSLAFLAFFSALIFTLRQTLLPRIIIALAATLYLLYMLYRSKWLLAEKNADEKS